MRTLIFSFLLITITISDAFGQHAVYLNAGGQLNIQAGASITIKGGTSLATNSQLVNNGNIFLDNASNSYWTDSSFLIGSLSGSGKVYFEGSAPFRFYGGSNFYDAIINCASLWVDSITGITVTNRLYLKKGIVNTGPGFLAIENSTSNSLVADPSNPEFSLSYINGNLRRDIAPNTNVYDFPVGDTSGLHWLKLQNYHLTGLKTLSASYGVKKGIDAGLNAFEGSAYASVHNKGVWYLSSDSVPASGSYDLQLSIAGYTGLLDNQFGILARPALSSDGADWIVPAGSSLPAAGSPGRIVAPGYAQRNNLSSFSNPQFGISMKSGPLPVSLTSFKGKRISSRLVQLEWQTKSESNNNGFFVERKTGNETVFTRVGWVKSKGQNGNSATSLNYDFIDTSNSFSHSTYRLNQLDLDGSFTYSPLVIIKNAGVKSHIFPNPSGGIVNIEIDKAGNYHYLIIDAIGKTIKTGSLSLTGNISLQQLPNGHYTIIVTNDNNEKILVEKIVLSKN